MALGWKLAVVLAMAAVMGELGCSAFDFEVGGEKGWAVPPLNHSGIYNQWASENRFKIGDNLKFKYNKDSVMMVGELEYKKCSSEQPILFSNNGETEVALEHSGTYYFISGLREHCLRGQKMIIKVLSQPETPSAAAPAEDQTPAAASPTPLAAGPSGASAALKCGVWVVVGVMMSALFM